MQSLLCFMLFLLYNVSGVRECHCSQGKVRKREDTINKRGRGAVNVVRKDFHILVKVA